jgi:nitrogen fixation NifU-like protein
LSSELRDLYQTTILDHNRRPRNFRVPEGANREAEGHNPLCGDDVKVYLRVADGVVEDVGFQGSGCAISTASASMMTQVVKGRRLEEVKDLFEAFHALVAGDASQPPDPELLGKLRVFSGVREFPVRVKCATLAWHTLKAAAEGSSQVVKTE